MPWSEPARVGTLHFIGLDPEDVCSVLQIPQRMRLRRPRAVEHREHVGPADLADRLESPHRLLILVDDQRAHAFDLDLTRSTFARGACRTREIVRMDAPL